MEFVTRLEEKADHVLDSALAELKQAGLEHYQRERPEVSRERLSALMNLMFRCLKERRAEPVIEYADRIARERHAAGYDLFEVQVALNVLEEALWKQVLATVAQDAAPRVLGLISSILGMVKDELARTYVKLVAGQNRTVPPAMYDG
jgi:hypothetical protein